MKISNFSPSNQPFDLKLEYYHGKDFVHWGSFLPLKPKLVWKSLGTNTKKNIRRAQNLKGLEIQRVKGTREDINIFRTIWFNPNDPTLEDELHPDQIMYLAYVEKKITAGMILTPAGENYFLHNLGGDNFAKRKGITSLLLWHAVNDLQKTPFQHIDIGASFRKSLQTFFSHWRVRSYPIIFEAPYSKPMISLSPFSVQNLRLGVKKNNLDTTIVEKYFGNKYTIFPRAIYGLGALFQYLSIAKKDNVAIFKTFPDNTYLARTVQTQIERFAKISWGKITKRTKIILVIHEFGYPCSEVIQLKKIRNEKGIVLVEDCAWGIESTISGGQRIGDFGDYVIYSLPKILPLQYGGLVKGLQLTEDEMWGKYKVLDYYKTQIILEGLSEELLYVQKSNSQKVRNFRLLQEYFQRDGYHPVVKLTGKEGISPAGFLLQLHSKQQMNALYKRYLDFGIETARYYHKNALLLPIHQNLSKQMVDYIYAVFRGTLNFCIDYKRGDHEDA